MRRLLTVVCGLLPFLATDADARRLYTLTIEWDPPASRIQAFETSFYTYLGSRRQIRIVANESEREQIVGEWGAQVGDMISRESRVEIGELSGWDNTIRLSTYESMRGDVLFAATLLDLAGGEVGKVHVGLAPEGEEVTADRLAYMISRLLPPRAVVIRKARRDEVFVTLDAGSADGIEVGQKLVYVVDGLERARLQVTRVRIDGSEARIEAGDLEEGDDVAAVLPEIPPDRSAPLYIMAPNARSEFSVIVDGIPRGTSLNGYVEIPVWPGLHDVKLTGAVQHEARVDVGPSGHRMTVSGGSQQGRLKVASAIPGIVRVRAVGSPDWRQLGETGLAIDLAPGTYEVRVVAAGHLPWTKETVIGLGTQSLQAELPPATGMVRVPGGPFRAGHPSVPDRPQRNVVLDDFLLDAREVTVVQFRRFQPDYAPPFGYPSQAPVVGVSYHDAAGYCGAAGKRLPTEDEWERACRGPLGARYGYGESFDVQRTDARSAAQAEPYPQRDMPANSYGLYGMTGGVWEWCDANTEDIPQGDARALRGGAWRMNDPTRHADCVYRVSMPASKEAITGFRCAADTE